MNAAVKLLLSLPLVFQKVDTSGLIVLLTFALITALLGVLCLALPYQIQQRTVKVFASSKLLTKITPGVHLLETRFFIWELRILGVAFIMMSIAVVYLVLR